MKKAIICLFIGLSLLVFMIFIVFPMGMEWLKGESHDCD